MIGLAGLFIEFYLVRIRPWLKINNKITAIMSALASKDTWLAAIVMALFISMLHAASWPSGVMEGLTNNGFDFHSWIFMAEDKLGLIDATNPSMAQRFNSDRLDALGTHVLLAFISIGRAQIPLIAAPAIVVTFVVWFGTALYELVRQAFKFNFLQSLFVSIALCLGNLFSYISLMGMFGHLIFLILFIFSLSQLIKYNKIISNFKQYIKRQFVPFFTLFLAYQSGYILFSSFIILFTFILIFASYKIKLSSRIYKSLYFSLGTFLIISCLSFLLMPGLTYHLFIRSNEVANQTEGWPLTFFNPLLFSGLPFYLSTDQFRTLTPDFPIRIYHYFPLIAVSLLLTILIHVRYNINDKKLSSNENINYIFSLVSIFIIAIVFYLYIYNLYYNIYKIWKFAAFIILPLSFIPLCLVIYLLNNYFKSKFKLLSNLIIIITMIISSYLLLNSKFLQTLKYKYYTIISINHYFNNLISLNKNFKSYNYLVFTNNTSLILPTIMTLSKNDNKLLFYYRIAYIPASILTFKTFTNKLLFITDRNYKGIINSTKNPNSYNIHYFNIYSYEILKELGFIFTKSNDKFNYSWQITNFPTAYNFIIPNKLVNKDIIFSLVLSPNQDFSPPCHQVEFGLAGAAGQINWQQKSIKAPNFFIPAELTATGQLEIFARLSFVKEKKCLFNIDSLDLIPYTSSNLNY
jgi:hypothetical protein